MGCRAGAAEWAFLRKKKKGFSGWRRGRLPRDVLQVCEMLQQVSRREQRLGSPKLGLQHSKACHGSKEPVARENRAVLPWFGLAVLRACHGQVVAGQAVRRLLAGVERLWPAGAVSCLVGTGKA